MIQDNQFAGKPEEREPQKTWQTAHALLKPRAGSAGDMGMLQQLGQASTGGRSMASEGPAEARAGPRIFIGKLNKDTSETDVRVSSPCARLPAGGTAPHCFQLLWHMMRLESIAKAPAKRMLQHHSIPILCRAICWCLRGIRGIITHLPHLMVSRPRGSYPVAGLVPGRQALITGSERLSSVFSSSPDPVNCM